ncbi:efflux RND transporter periplasmic adaptor subunit [Variovorax sp. JS1663]|uniref:efflux RND transporter periplasmic adaptor subunit n=1 Tax=Variovorax sp. JS1663 TaxID=1851577 RepID=UPI000B349E59|nr:biotin/lipoyl-binding protein [Variovorax sp. JS1663]OUM02838.1 efflux transporter periplasmic adaptor subunit [Variovorax sp. JS1663]
MQVPVRRIVQVGITAAAVVLGALASVHLWHHYREAPWTRDGRVRADVVQVAPDVSGLVESVAVRDNQEVRQGDLLFSIDAVRPRIALAQAEASVRGLKSQIAQAQREDRRNRSLGELVPGESREQSGEKIEQLNASLAQAQAAVDSAKVNLARTQVRAPADGWVTNLVDLRPGSYATAGRPLLAVVDRQSIHVLGYFEETKVARVHVGDVVRVHLIGERQPLYGHVDSVAAGIEDRDRNPSSNLLANVNPTFNWVRLAQRIPVRVRLDDLPEDRRLIMGRTASVDVIGPESVQVGQRQGAGS